MTNIPIFLYLEYFATGEGHTVSLGLCLAESKSAAIRTFLTATILKHTTPEHFEDGITYFTHGMIALDLTEPAAVNEAKRIMSKYIKRDVVEFLIQAETDQALHEFMFHYYVNYS